MICQLQTEYRGGSIYLESTLVESIRDEIGETYHSVHITMASGEKHVIGELYWARDIAITMKMTVIMIKP